MFQAPNQAAVLDHQFRVAAYVVTWAIQLGYVLWLAIRWRAQKREAERLAPGWAGGPN